ncbi:MAG: HEPN domain-containing protein [Treponema sp.]|jgi:HEPN domain-containing protein|nr:HEPN domain-containing protein [Treponema sp.]
MEHEEIVKQWIELADKDLALARHTAKTMWPIPHEIVCFHCQQFTEKYLKAFLVSKGQEPPYIHDLAKLASLCEAENQEFGQIKQKCIILTEYGVQPRYPGGMQIIEEDMVRALHFAEDINNFMREKAPELFNTPML